jgi:heptosyltransferase-2
MKLALFLPNWLGDMVMATPAVRAMRRHYGPSARLVGIMRPGLAGLLAGTGWLDDEWYYAPRAKAAEQGTLRLVGRMRRERFDVAVLLPNSLRTAAVAWLGGARQRIGYARYGRGPLLTRKLFARREGRRLVAQPMVDYYLALAEAAGCPPESPRLELALTEPERERGDAIWRSLGLRAGRHVVALNSSGAYGAAKLWPVEKCAGLARRIAEQGDCDVLVLCGPGEEPSARAIAQRAAHARVFALAGQPLGLAATKACLARCCVTVSTDSGPRHVAAAFGKPVITLFGPTTPVWTANPEVRSVDVQLDLECAGCAERTCPLGHHRCMRDLPVERVYGEVRRLLEENSAVRAA